MPMFFYSERLLGIFFPFNLPRSRRLVSATLPRFICNTPSSSLPFTINPATGTIRL